MRVTCKFFFFPFSSSKRTLATANTKHLQPFFCGCVMEFGREKEGGSISNHDSNIGYSPLSLFFF